MKLISGSDAYELVASFKPSNRLSRSFRW